MASRSTLHEWINSAGVIVTFSIAAFSAWISWTAYLLKKEDISATVTPNNNCRVEYAHFSFYDTRTVEGILGFCWNVTLANKSENKLSILRTRIFSVNKGGAAQEMITGFRDTEGLDGKPVDFPIVLDGGSAYRLVVRAPVVVPLSVSAIIDKLPQTFGKAIDQLSLDEVEIAVAEHNLSLLGYSIQIEKIDNSISSRHFPYGFKAATAFWEVETGRGQKFKVLLEWPPPGTTYGSGGLADTH